MTDIRNETATDKNSQARRSLTIIDDIMFGQMAKDASFMQEILRTILRDPGLTVLESVPQEKLTPYLHRAVVVDCLCRTSDGRIINVEVQKSSGNIDHQKRVRYHSSVLTVENTPPGTPFDMIPDVTVIYICGFDIFDQGRAMYTVERVIAETGKILYNGYKEIYITPAEDDSDISELMKVFTDAGTYSDRFPVTSSLKKYYRTTPEGAEEMDFTFDEYLEECLSEARKKAISEGLAEGREEGRAKGREEGLAEGREAGLAEGREEGLAEGRAEGMAMGLEKGRAEFIDRIISAAALGTITREAAQALCGMSGEELDKHISSSAAGK